MASWTLNDIPWNLFDPAKVQHDHLALAKTASLVEYNSADYVQYLRNIFKDDPTIFPALDYWGKEEKQHGEVLARWASLADPGFNFSSSLKRFRDSYQVPVNVHLSVRGSQSAELIARCIVECGTMTYYGSLAEASDEPALKTICLKIADDEVRHYRMFFHSLKKYLKKQPLSTLQKLRVAINRCAETSDEELLYAYAAGNLSCEITKEQLPLYFKNYMGRVFDVYSLRHLNKGITLACKAVGLDHYPFIAGSISMGLYVACKTKAKFLM